MTARGCFVAPRLYIICVVILGMYCALLETRAISAPVCSYQDKPHEEGDVVVTDEPCLSCRCLRGSLVCYLRVCPKLPDPPPVGCVLVLRKGACCSELRCEDSIMNTNHISRAEVEGGDIETPSNYGSGCILNGSLFASGSALSSSSDCEHCFCIGGRQRCVRPKCLLPLDGCIPIFHNGSCCPSNYDCEAAISYSSSTSTTRRPTPFSGCTVDGKDYNEGDKVRGATSSPCDNCFCMRGLIRCMPLSCSPPLLGCKPVILPGECCPHSYKCEKGKEVKKTISDQLLEIDNAFHHKKSDDRSLHSNHIRYREETRITREITTERNISTTEESLNSTFVQNQGTSGGINYTSQNENMLKISSPLRNITSTSTMKIHVPNSNASTSIETMNTSIINQKNINTPDNLDKEFMKMDNLAFNNETNNTSKCNNQNNSSMTSNNSSIEVFSRDQLNVTKENNKNETKLLNESLPKDAEEKYSGLNIKTEVDKHPAVLVTNSINSNTPYPDTKLSTTSFNIPKNNDFFMVNVSTLVKTNETSIKMAPIASITSHLEDVIHIKRKDDDFEYDYNESSLPPSLPNLKIIPFVAADAVLKHDERISEQNLRSSPHYSSAYPLIDRTDEYHRESYLNLGMNQTKYLITKSANKRNPTPFPIYVDEKYLTHPTRFSFTGLKLRDIQPEMMPKLDSSTKETHEIPIAAHQLFTATEYPIALDEIQTQFPMYDFNPASNLFSPPVETEGGFVPKEAPVPMMNNYFENRYTVSYKPDVIKSSSTTKTLQKESISEKCHVYGKHYKHGELITEMNACNVCICFYGEIQCQEPACPTTRPGCYRLNKNSNDCCGKEICDDAEEIINTNAHNNHLSILTSLLSQSTEAENSNKTDFVAFTEQLETLRPMPPDTAPSTGDVIFLTESPLSPTSEQTDIVEESTTMHNNKTTTIFNDSYSEIELNQKELTTAETTPIVTVKTAIPTEPTLSSTSEPLNQTLDYDMNDNDEEEDTFSFGSVLKLLLGDSYESLEPSSKYRPKPIFDETSKTTQKIITEEENYTTNKPITIPKKTTDWKTSLPLLNPVTELIKTVTTGNKIFTKPYKYSTRLQQTTYFTDNSFTVSTVPKRTHHTQSNFIPYGPYTKSVTQTTIKPTKPQKAPNIAQNPLAPFTNGVLKLAGCNIYGRMYRVGRIISELSGPCIECMCTEVGVQCTHLKCTN